MASKPRIGRIPISKDLPAENGDDPNQRPIIIGRVPISATPTQEAVPTETLYLIHQALRGDLHEEDLELLIAQHLALTAAGIIDINKPFQLTIVVSDGPQKVTVVLAKASVVNPVNGSLVALKKADYLIFPPPLVFDPFVNVRTMTIQFNPAGPTFQNLNLHGVLDVVFSAALKEEIQLSHFRAGYGRVFRP